MSKEQETNQKEMEQDNVQDVSFDNNQDFYSGFSPLDEPVR